MLKRIALLLTVLALAAAAAFVRNGERARLAWWRLTGRSPHCTLLNAMDAPAELRRQTAFKDKILAASKKIETDDKGFELWDTPKGRFWIPKGSHYVLPFNLAEQERKIYSLSPVEIRNNDVVLDCGANVGVFSREALRQGAATVVAIEPAPENIECLRRNFVDDIASGRLVVYPKGVWDKEDKLTLHVDSSNSAADSFVIQRPGAKDVLELPLTTIDQIVDELKLDEVNFVKMDIEGAEVRALRGGKRTLARYHPRLALSAYHVPTDPVEIPKAVREAWPRYQLKCGVCAVTETIVRPDILFFY